MKINTNNLVKALVAKDSMFLNPEELSNKDKAVIFGMVESMMNGWTPATVKVEAFRLEGTKGFIEGIGVTDGRHRILAHWFLGTKEIEIDGNGSEELVAEIVEGVSAEETSTKAQKSEEKWSYKTSDAIINTSYFDLYFDNFLGWFDDSFMSLPSCKI